MKASLLDYFHHELAYLHNAGEEFAKIHPKLANDLKLITQGSKDPQITMLLEGIALLNARIYAKLAEEFPEVTENLLNMLYPHYLASLPSMSVVQFLPTTDLNKPFEIPAATSLETDPGLAERCCFRTGQETYLLPIEVEHAELSQNLPDHIRPLTAVPCASGLKLTLRCLDADMKFSQLKPKKLRFYLQGQWHYTLSLYELLLKSTQTVALLNNFHSTSPIWLTSDCIQAVGFNDNEALLPYDSRSSIAYRLLTEYFIYPERFLFIDINLDQVNLDQFDNKLHMIIYFQKNNPQLIQHVNANTLVLNAAPVVNLFSTSLEPVAVDHQHYQYPLLADHRRPEALDIYSIDEVIGINQNGEICNYLPFYGLDDRSTVEDQRTYWCLHRKKYDGKNGENYATQSYMSFVNLDLAPTLPDDTTLYIKATCMNRELPEAILYAEDKVILQLTHDSAPIIGARFILAPSQLREPLVNNRSMSSLIAHLGLNHVSLVDPSQGITHLKKVIELYQSNEVENSTMIDSIVGMEVSKITRRMQMGIYQAFCQGIKIQLKIDERYFPGQSAYLFAKILERFFEMYITINSFIELEVINSQNNRSIFQGKPMAGDKKLL